MVTVCQFRRSFTIYYLCPHLYGYKSQRLEGRRLKSRSPELTIATLKLTWGVYGKTDRVHFVELDTYYFLDGRP